MQRFLTRLNLAVIAVLLSHTAALACVYPTPLRVANGTLLAVLDQGGTVSVHQRNRLARAMEQMAPDIVKKTISQDARRRDARAAHAVIDTAFALASGRGMTVDEAMWDHVTRLDQAIDVSCSGSDSAVSGSQDANGTEHGLNRQDNRGGRPVTFSEGVTRLSLTFTLYMVFLAFLFGLRRHLRHRITERAGASEPLRSHDANAS